MTTLRIKFGKNPVSSINTISDAAGNKRFSVLKTVGDMILVAAIQPNQGLLGLPDNVPLTLHLPEGVDRAASGLPDECFATVDEGDTTLDIDCQLSALISLSIGVTSKKPLIIKCESINVLDYALYRLHFISSSDASTQSTYGVHPESVAHWDDFVTNAAAYNVPSHQSPFQVPRDTIIGMEPSMYSHFSGVFEWARNSLTVVGEDVFQDISRADVKGKPDFFFCNGRDVFLTLEVKRPKIVPFENLLTSYIALRQDALNGLVKAVHQEFGYMVNNDHQFGVLSTWEKTWFFKRGTNSDTSNTLFISDCVSWDSTNVTNVTFIKALAYMVDLARRAPPVISSRSVRQSPRSSQSSLTAGSANRMSNVRQGFARRSQSSHIADASSTNSQTYDIHALKAPMDRTLLASSSLATLNDSEMPCLPEPFSDYMSLQSILGQRLGYGRCGTVYECVVGGIKSAVKLMDPGKSATVTLLQESEAYCSLVQLQSVAIPRLVLPATEYMGMLVLATEKASEGICEMFGNEEKRLALNSLRMIHQLGYIHGDIRKQNVVFHVAGGIRKALWIDLETCRLGLTLQEFEYEIQCVGQFC